MSNPLATNNLLTNLTADQCHAIHTYLSSAAERYSELRKACATSHCGLGRGASKPLVELFFATSADMLREYDEGGDDSYPDDVTHFQRWDDATKSYQIYITGTEN